ncbi:MAG TPA: hypothetical protein VHM66_14155 [Solirubrobacterales bacterium]|nr:hypothetical protein [Solirubrobacterales bacterium]
MRVLIAAASSERRNGKLAGTKLRKQIAEIDRKIRAQVQALEKGVEPELVSERIAELRADKEALADANEASPSQNDGKLTATVKSSNTPETQRTPISAGVLWIAGARFVSRDHPRIVERMRHPV